MEKGVRIKADPTKVGWEDSEFPILCETCLGDNPYVRMTREPFGGACKVCERPFTKFRWKAGSKGRFKTTVTCQMCSKIKNTCQCCILDLQYGECRCLHFKRASAFVFRQHRPNSCYPQPFHYAVPSFLRASTLLHSIICTAGLPVEVRDKVLNEAASSLPGGALALTGGAGLGGSLQPTSDVNRQYAMNQALTAMGDGAVVPYSGAAAIAPAAHEQLLRMGRARQGYDRNAAKLCSFFARGECNRGAECPYRHEMPKDRDDPLSKQNYKDRYYGSEDPVAAKLLAQAAERRAARPESSPESMPEHDDVTACTVWVGGLGDAASAEDVR